MRCNYRESYYWLYGSKFVFLRFELLQTHKLCGLNIFYKLFQISPSFLKPTDQEIIYSFRTNKKIISSLLHVLTCTVLLGYTQRQWVWIIILVYTYKWRESVILTCNVYFFIFHSSQTVCGEKGKGLLYCLLYSGCGLISALELPLSWVGFYVTSRHSLVICSEEFNIYPAYGGCVSRIVVVAAVLPS